MGLFLKKNNPPLFYSPYPEPPHPELVVARRMIVLVKTPSFDGLRMRLLKPLLLLFPLWRRVVHLLLYWLGKNIRGPGIPARRVLEG